MSDIGHDGVLRMVSRFEDRDAFLDAFHPFIDDETILVITKRVPAPGVPMRFSVELKGGTPVLRGEGVAIGTPPQPEPGKTVNVRLRVASWTDPDAEAAHQELLERKRRKLAPPPPPPKKEEAAPEDDADQRATGQVPALNPPWAALAAQRTPGSSYQLPANPLSEIPDRMLENFIECVLHPDPGGPSDREPSDPRASESTSAMVTSFRSGTADPALALAPAAAAPAAAAPAVAAAATPAPPPAPVVVRASAATHLLTAALAAAVAGMAVYIYLMRQRTEEREVVMVPAPAVAPAGQEPPPAAPQAPPAAPQTPPAAPQPLAAAPEAPPAAPETPPAAPEAPPAAPETPPAAPEAPVAATGDGCKLSLTTHEEARVYIGAAEAVRPPVNSEIPCDEATLIAVVHPRYQRWERKVVGRRDAPVVLDAQLSRELVQLSVSTAPGGATIAVDGRIIGKSPARTEVKGYTSVLVTASLDGYKLWSRRVKLTSANGVNARLEPIPGVQ